MIVFVPVTRFRITYELAEGLPYSYLDRMVLEAVRQKTTELDQLVQTFELHPRLLVQSLVTLTQAGWVALGNSSEQQFVLTPSGKQALKKDKLPVNRITVKRKTFVLLDCITGTVVLENQVQYVSKWRLKREGLWNRSACLKPYLFDSKLDESEICHLLPRRQGQRLHWVGPIDLVGKNNNYIIVDVDPEKEKILNLPSKLEINLAPYLFEKSIELLSINEDVPTMEDLQEYSQGYRGKKTNLKSFLRKCSFQWNPENLLISNSQHIETIKTVFEEAFSTIFIAGSTVTVSCLESFKYIFAKALERDVNIQILRGYQSKDDSLEWLKKFSYDCKQKNFSGEILFNKSLALSNAKIILWDSKDGVYHAITGSYDWLSISLLADSHGYQFLSLKLSHPGIISDLSRYAADLWKTSQSEKRSGVPMQWRKISTELEQKRGDDLSNFDDKAIIRVIFNRETNKILTDWLRNTQLQLYLSTDKLDSSAFKYFPLIDNLRGSMDEFKIQAQYNFTDLDDKQLELMTDTLNTFSGSIKKTPLRNANVVVSDSSAFLSSASLLGCSIKSDQNVREIGIIIEGAQPVAQIISHFFNDH